MAKYFFLRMFALLPKTFGGIKTILNSSSFDRISATEQASMDNWGVSSGPTIMVPGCPPDVGGKWGWGVPGASWREQQVVAPPCLKFECCWFVGLPGSNPNQRIRLDPEGGMLCYRFKSLLLQW